MKRRLPFFLLVAAPALLVGVWLWQGQGQRYREISLLENAPALKPENQHPPSIVDRGVEAVVHGGLGYRDLLQRINGLHRWLSPDDGYHLLVWATSPRPQRFSVAVWAELSNDTLNILRSQTNPPQEMASRMIGMFRDPASPNVMKDYAIQHLGGWLADRDARAAWEKNPDNQKIIASLIMEAAAKVDTSYAGTALYQLIEISARLPALVPPARLGKLIATAVENPSTNKLARISALQAASAQRITSVLPSARKLAFDDSTDASLRLSAVACLGQVGESSDAVLLQKIFESSSGTRLHAALEPAIAKLKKTVADAR